VVGEPGADAAALVETLLPSRRLLVVGATPVGTALARLAVAAEIPVEVIEPRSAYAAALEDAPVVVDGRWPDEALADREADASTAVAVVAHDERIDVAALEGVLRRPYGYVGLLGGGRTRRRRFEALRAAGVPEARITAVRAPIGLDLGAERPAEIALAILAQIVADWRGTD
jgi:xanthine dehydrogenase accessory factor